jgi:hypothetical protein
LGNLWRAWAMAVIGAWFFVSAWLFDVQVTEFSVFGALMLILALWVAFDHPQAQPWRIWLLAAFSGWMAILPSIVPFGAGALADGVTMAAGLIGVILSLWMAAARRPPGGLR